MSRHRSAYNDEDMEDYGDYDYYDDYYEEEAADNSRTQGAGVSIFDVPATKGGAVTSKTLAWLWTSSSRAWGGYL